MGAKQSVVEDNVQNSVQNIVHHTIVHHTIVQNNERQTSVSDGEYKDLMLNPNFFFNGKNIVKFSGRIINGLRQGYGKTVFENNQYDSLNYTEYAFYNGGCSQGKCLRIGTSNWIEYSRNRTESFIVNDKSHFISSIAYQSVCKKITMDERYTYVTTTYPNLLTTDVFVSDNITKKHNSFINVLFIPPKKLLEGLYPSEYDYLKNPELLGKQEFIETQNTSLEEKKG